MHAPAFCREKQRKGKATDCPQSPRNTGISKPGIRACGARNIRASFRRLCETTMGLTAITEKIEIGAPADQAFRFATDTEHIPRILPRALRANVARRSHRHLGPGTTLDLTLHLVGFALRAEVAVAVWEANRHVGYVWRSGPFHPWEHDIWFEPLSTTRCRIIHCLIYRPPWGVLGAALDFLWFRRTTRRALRRLGPSWEAGARKDADHPSSTGITEI